MKIRSLSATKLFVIVLLSATISAQNKLDSFPDNLLVQPFKANTLEPKLGFEFKTDKNELSLNVGSSLDIIHYKLNDKNRLSFGADLFTYTLLRSQSDFHFPVDAIDYLFGINFGYKKKYCNSEFGARLRLSHISAHFVDGHFDKESNQWLDGRAPKVYSREFLELMPYYQLNDFRVYAGLTYIFSIDPANIGTDQYQIGFDYFATQSLNDNFIPYIAYDFRLLNIYGYTGNNSLELGIKFGYAHSKGLSVYLRYFSGYNIHGEYFDVKEKFTSLGFNFDL